MKDDEIYTEKITSNRTELLFLVLMMLFLLLFLWRVLTTGLDALAVVLLCLGGIFFFYVLNYRTLRIEISTERLKLTFGVLRWTVALDNIESCALDDMPVVMKYGGAGIHFMMIRKRYRVLFNFLEYPRVVIGLKKKAGLVCDLSFTTCQPEVVLNFLRERMSIQPG